MSMSTDAAHALRNDLAIKVLISTMSPAGSSTSEVAHAASDAHYDRGDREHSIAIHYRDGLHVGGCVLESEIAALVALGARVE